MPQIQRRERLSSTTGICLSDFRLSIVIPAYNEELNIGDAIQEVVTGLPSFISEYELLIVDDGSSDRTPEIVRRMSAENQRIKLISLGRNMGYGAALTTGFRNASGNWILFLDADGQIGTNELPAFFEASRGYDLIIGFRTGRCDSLIRRVLSKGYARLVAVTLGGRVRDINCPFKLFRKTFMDEVVLNSQGFLINAELLHKAGLKDEKIKEIPVRFRDRQKGKSTVRWRHFFETVRELLKLLRGYSRSLLL